MKLDDLGATPGWTAPDEWAYNAEDMLHLISPQPQFRLHAQNDSAGLSKASKINGREPCYIHPDCAARHQLSEGDIALIENHRGRTLAGVIITAQVRPDTIVLPTGAWMETRTLPDGKLEIHGNRMFSRQIRVQPACHRATLPIQPLCACHAGQTRYLRLPSLTALYLSHVAGNLCRHEK